ncbi:MAG: hypothetical protein ACJAXA_002958, partial [Candidatus Aldehydirespiratoraceae bacterium]
HNDITGERRSAYCDRQRAAPHRPVDPSTRGDAATNDGPGGARTDGAAGLGRPGAGTHAAGHHDGGTDEDDTDDGAGDRDHGAGARNVG